MAIYLAINSFINLYDPSKGGVDADMMDVGKEALTALTAVDSLNQRYGAGIVVLFIKGSKANKIQDWMTQLKGYGEGRD